MTIHEPRITDVSGRRAAAALVLWAALIALHTHLFFTYDQRALIDHDRFYTANALQYAMFPELHPFGSIFQLTTQSTHDRPQLVNAYLAVVLRLFTPSIYVFRMANLPFHFLLMIGAYLLGSGLNGRRTGVLAAIIVGTFPPFINMLHRYTFHYHAWGLSAIGLALTLSVVKKETTAPLPLFAVLGAIYGLAVLCHPVALIWAGLSLCWLVLSRFYGERGRPGASRFYVGVLCAAGVFLLFGGSWLFSGVLRFTADNALQSMDAGVKTAPGLTAGELLGVVRMLTIDLPKHVRGASVAHVVFAWGVPLLSIAVLGVKNFRVDKYRRAAELFLFSVVLLLAAAVIRRRLLFAENWLSIYVPLIALATAYLMSPAGSWRRIGNTVIGVVIVGQLALMLYLFYASKNSAAEPWTVFDGLFFRSEERLVRQDSHSVFHVNFTPPPCRNIGTALAHHYPAGSNVNVTGAAPAGDPTEIAQAPERHDGVGSCDLPDYLLSAFRGGTRAVDGDLADRVNPAQAILVAFPAADFAEAKQRLGVFWPKIRAAYPTYEVLTLVWDGDQPGNVGSGNFHVLMAPPLR